MSSSRDEPAKGEWMQSDARFRAVLQHSSDIVTVLARDGTVLYNSPAVERILGYRPEELNDKVALEFIHPDDQPEVALRLGEGLSKPGVPVQVEFRFRHRDGRWVPLDAVGINYLDDESVGALIVSSRDVSDRERAEMAYRTLVDHSLQGLAIMQHGRMVFANQALAEISGYTVEELLALEPEQLRHTSHPDDLARITEQWRARRAGHDVPPRAEFRIVQKDGSIRWVETYSSTIDYRGEPATHVAYVDSTERRRADEEKTALLQIARDLTGASDRREITDRVLKRTAALLPLTHAFVAYWDAERDVYRPIAGVGSPLGTDDDLEAVVFPPDHPIVMELRHGGTIVINDVGDQRWLAPEMLKNFGVRALLIAPLFVRDRATGGLVAVRASDHPPFSDGEARLFEGIAHQLALCLDAADRHEAEMEETAITAAHAAVAREMITSLSRPNLLERLCEVTAKTLGSDRSHTFLFEPRERCYVPAATHGLSPEEWDSLRQVRVPEVLCRELLERVRVEEAVPIYAGEATFPGSLLQQVGTAGVLVMALHRGDEIIGLQAAVLAQPGRRFSARQVRIGRGIAQLASLSIEDARLVNELERANRLKSEFVATMSHELRTPLNIILGYNSLMLEDAFGPLTEEQRDTLSRVETNARSLLELINTTLDMSRLEAGQIRLDLNAVHVGDLLDDVRRETRELQQKDGVQFVWEPAENLPQVRTDAAKVKVVLRNLLGNAIKFTDNGTITIGARSSGSGVEFRVADTGIGIDAESLPIIFEAFRQVDGALTRRHGGVGLGLYIVQRLLRELGGSVEVESTPGKGSVFRVWLPASHPEA